MNNIDQKIKDAMAKKVVGRTTEVYKAVVLELYRRITANSLQVGLAYGSPVLTAYGQKIGTYLVTGISTRDTARPSACLLPLHHRYSTLGT